MFNLKDFKTIFNIILFIMLIYLLYCNKIIDTQNNEILSNTPCHKEVNLPEININDRMIIESVIEEYWKKRTMNKSNCSKIIHEILSGCVKGAVSGIIYNRGIKDIIPIAITSGAVSGVFKAYSLKYNKLSFLQQQKHT